MSRDVFNPAYWRERIEWAIQNKNLHWSIFYTGAGQFSEIEERHRAILADLIKPGDSIFDAGCGYGRVLDLLPKGNYRYLGVDISPDFITLAQTRHIHHTFRVHDLREPIQVDAEFEWAIAGSMRPMIRGNCGPEAWETIKANIFRVAKKILYLECNVDEPGEVECRP